MGPLQDMWSLGCILIEAAVWVCFGRRGRLIFQQRRRDENNEVAPEQRDLERSDCFHNGKARLKTVDDVFDLVQRDGRRSDELTPRIVRLVLDHLLVDEELRYDTRVLLGEFGTMIRTTTDWPETLSHSSVTCIVPSRTPSESSITLLESNLGDRRYPQSSMSITSDDLQSDISRYVKTEAANQEQTGHITLPAQYSDHPWPAQSVPTRVTARLSGVTTPSQFGDSRRAALVDDLINELYPRRAEDKTTKLRRLFQGEDHSLEDQAMLFLKKRDHVSQRITI